MVRRDGTRFRAFALAVAMQMLALPVLAHWGWVQLSIPAFYPLGAVLGGYVFGLAMGWAGGCAAGLWYKWGSGDWGCFAALVGMIGGAVATEAGPLRWVREQVQQVGSAEEIRTATLGKLLGAEWIVYPLGGLILLWLARSRANTPAGAWSWPRTGIALGLLGILAWPLSGLAGRFFGMAVLPGSTALLDFAVTGQRSSLNWDLLLVLGLPLGAYLAARQQGPVCSEPVPGPELVRALGGGLLLGVGASLAGGCTVGHSLVGVPLLSVGSIVTTVFILLGSWTTGYFELRKKGSR
ncbi:MAG: YeeE/YedE family protein [Candidatus Latescibacteria bacterium]|nr:YeeE/YedE family protein [Candidatus Latescibacterota bacterium]